MTPRDTVAQAVAGVTTHRLRAVLSSLGIVFGVGTVMAALAIGNGARHAAIEEIATLGVDNVLIRTLPEISQSRRRDRRDAPVLTIDDARVIGATVPGVAAVAALRTMATEVTAGRASIKAVVIGTTVAWQAVVQVAPSSGRWLADSDVRNHRRVAILGQTAARSLFGREDPIGRRVFTAGDWHQVVGILPSSGRPSTQRAAIQAHDLDKAVIVPVTAMDTRLSAGDSGRHVEEIAVRAASAGEVSRVAKAATEVLRRRHPAERAWEVIVPKELLAARLRAQRTFDAVLFGVGGLALLISGIGIMNIMLVSVAERTQEIGVRRAFGARRSEVVAQFAVEAVLLCVAGAGAGVPVGVLLSATVAIVAGWPVAVSLSSTALALALAAAAGLVFGVYPALRAARLDPVEALRA